MGGASPGSGVIRRGLVEQDSTQQIIAAFRKGSQESLVGRMGITISDASAERVTGSMPVTGNTQPYGLLHGGASCVLAETLGSVGAVMPGQSVGRPFAVGVDINATHHKASRTGLVTGVATPVHRGRSSATYE